MKSARTRSLILVALIGALGSVATAQQPVSRQETAAVAPSTDRTAVPVRRDAASTPVAGTGLLSVTVADVTGERLGRIRDLVIDPDGHITALVELEAIGYVGVPLDLLRPDGATQDGIPWRFLLATERTTVLTGPILEDVVRADGDWLRRTKAHYEPTPAGDDDAALAERVDDVTTLAAPGTLRLKSVLGAEVRSSSDLAPLGTVEDVAVSLGRAEVAYALVGASEPIGTIGSLHGVAWDLLAFDPASGLARAPLERAELRAAPALDRKHLPIQPDLPVSAADPTQSHPPAVSTTAAR